MSLTKDEIKDRLIRRAAETWGVDEMEIEFSFDPIVGILFDACAHEFERISDTIKTSRTKITERLVDLLTPEISVTAKPAHAVMHALPIESHIKINARSQFYHRKRKPIFNQDGKDGFDDYAFCPAGEFTLNNCELQYIAYPDKILKHQNHRNLPFLEKGDFKANPEANCMYLGIRPGEGVKNIDQLLCYFDLLNFSQKELLAHHIGIAHWSLNGKRLDIVKGYNEQMEVRDDFSGYINESIQSKIRFYETYVKEFYQDHFYTVDSSLDVEQNLKNFPDIFYEFISDKHLKQFDEPLLWIKMEFSTVVSTSMLENLRCHINCFPVLNKKSQTLNKRLQPYFNILPLTVDEDFFFDIHEISGDTGNTYFIRDRGLNDHEHPNAYLRFGGVSRFDERDGSELLNYTLDLLKEDSVAFSTMGSDFIDSNLKNLKKIVSRIEQKIEQSDFNKRKIPYLIINRNSIQKNRDQHIYAEYWTTAGEKANKINPYVKLNAKAGTAFQPDSLTLVTGTLGGRDEPSPSDKIYAYREHVLSKGKVVTRQDIIQHCFSIYKSGIIKVTIEKGVMVSQDQGVGYTPTTDIHITKNTEIDYTEADWEHLKKELLINLRVRSANVLPFRVFYRCLEPSIS